MTIFISHQSRDKALVREFSQQLPDFLTKWIDEDSLSWGGSLTSSMRSAIKSGSDFLIVFITESTLESDWVRQELQWALEREATRRRVFILPILVGDVDVTSLPAELRDRLGLRLHDYEQSSVESLAKKATERLFELVVDSYDEQQERMVRLRDRSPVTRKQREILEFIARCQFVETEIVEGVLGYPHGSAELRYRLEHLELHGLIRGNVVRTDGTKCFSITHEYEEFKMREKGQ